MVFKKTRRNLYHRIGQDQTRTWTRIGKGLMHGARAQERNYQWFLANPVAIGEVTDVSVKHSNLGQLFCFWVNIFFK